MSTQSIPTRGTETSPGLVGVLAQLIFAGALAAVSLQASQPSPEPLPRGVALGLLYAAPAAVGWLGTLAGRRSLLLAAAIADVGGAPLSWSGFTLLFLVPAILFVGEVGRVASRPRSTIAWFQGLALGTVIAGLLVVAGVALLTLTEPLCWIATPGGSGIQYEIVPDIEGIPFSAGQSGGCDSAALTLHGLGIAGLLAIGAIALALVSVVGVNGLRTWSAPPRPR